MNPALMKNLPHSICGIHNLELANSNNEINTNHSSNNKHKMKRKLSFAIMEGSCKIGSVRPSSRLSGRFLGIGSLVFSETQHGVRGPCLVVHDRARFFLKKSFFPKNEENGPKTGFFEFIGKVRHWFFLNLFYREIL